MVRSLPVILLFSLALVIGSGCATSDSARLKESREAYLKGDFPKAEAALYTPEVFKNDQNRLEHFYLLSSVAMNEGLFEKALYFLNRAREIAISVRSESGLYEWFSREYKSNPIEYSYLHYMLVLANTELAIAGKTPAWSISEIKDPKGSVLVQGQNFPERTYSAKEIAEFRQKAHAELLAWDTFLVALKRSHPDDDFYKEDMWARMLASFIHASSGDRNEKRTAELLTDQAKTVFDHEFTKLPSGAAQSENIHALLDQLKSRAKSNKDSSSLLVCEAGVMPKLKQKRFLIGLSTLFKGINDPFLRGEMERMGMQVILNTAPEFGLVLLSGAVAGAVGGKDEDDFDGPPKYFTDAVDRSFGFEIRFPSMKEPPADTQATLRLVAKGGTSQEIKLSVVSPLQELVATELKNREGEMEGRAISIGLQYVAILIPAIKAYRAAVAEGNLLKKIAVLAGYYIAKKAIDHAHDPDLRSWSYLPKIIASSLLNVAPGDYQMILRLQNSKGQFEQDLGLVTLGDPKQSIVWKHVGDVPILNP